MDKATATTQLRTEDVLVTRWDFPPGSETGDHVHQYDYVVVPVTAGTLTIELQNAAGEREQVTAELTSGGSYNRSAGVAHNVINNTADRISFVEIELLSRPLAE